MVSSVGVVVVVGTFAFIAFSTAACTAAKGVPSAMTMSLPELSAIDGTAKASVSASFSTATPAVAMPSTIASTGAPAPTTTLAPTIVSSPPASVTNFTAHAAAASPVPTSAMTGRSPFCRTPGVAVFSYASPFHSMHSCATPQRSSRFQPW